MNNETANLKVTVTKQVRHALKVKTAQNGTTIQAILEEAINTYWGKKKPS